MNRHGFTRLPDIYRPHKDRERQPTHVGYDTDKAEIVQLGKQKYRREKVRNKVHIAGLDAQGKPIKIPYQTCTLVRAEVANEVSVPDPAVDRLPGDSPQENLPTG